MESDALFNVAAEYLIGLQSEKYKQYKLTQNSKLTVVVITGVMGLVFLFIKAWIGIALLLTASVYFFLYRRVQIEDVAESLGLGYIPLLCSAAEDCHAVMDLSGVMDQTEFQYSKLNRAGELIRTTKDTIELGRSLPAVQSNTGKLVSSSEGTSFPEDYAIYDRETDLYNNLDRLHELVADVSTDHTEIPFVSDRELLSELIRHSSGHECNEFLMEKLNADAMKGRLGKITGVYEGEAQKVNEIDLIGKVWKSIGVISDKFNSARGFSIGQLNSFFDSIDLSMAVSSYHFYCPECNREVIDGVMTRDYDSRSSGDMQPLNFAMNTRMLFQCDKSRWRCPVCETVTDMPVPVNRIVDEAIYPTYDYLIREHYEKRIEAYAHSNERIADIENSTSREIDKYYDELQGDIDSINTEILNLEAELEVNTRSISSYNEQLAKYEKIKMERLRNIEEHAISQQRRIMEETSKAVSEYDSFVDKELEEQHRKLQENLKQERILEAKRDEMQRNILEVQKKQLEVAEKTQKSVDEGTKAAKFTAACNRANSKKRGDLKPAAHNIPGRISYAVEEFSDSLSFKSNVGKEEGRV